MKEFPAKGKIESLPPTIGRFRARETLENLSYNPIKRLVDIDKKLDDQEGLEALKLQMDIAKKLLEYYAEKPPSQHQLAMTKSQHVIIRPAEFMDPEYLGTEGPSQPPVLDILGESPEDQVAEAYLVEAALEEESE